MSIQIGDARVTLVRAGTFWWDGGAMFGVVPRTLWSKLLAHDDLNRVPTGFNCFVIEKDGKRVLVETGGGVRHDERALQRMGLTKAVDIREAVSAHGFPPESIDIVINTHLHWDHVGGNTVGDGDPAFPNARYITQRGELLHAREQHPRDAISYRAINYEPLIEAGRMQLLDGDADVMPGLELRVLPGHNRNMMVVIVKSGGQTWCQMADLVPFTAQITPTWVCGFDLFPLESIDNKTALLTEAARDNWWCSFGHDPFTAFAQVSLENEKWRLQATHD